MNLKILDLKMKGNIVEIVLIFQKLKKRKRSFPQKKFLLKETKYLFLKKTEKNILLGLEETYYYME